MFFNGWQPILRTLLLGIFSYIGLVMLLRISGKRTLSKLNAFDFVVTIALGSTLSSIITSPQVSLIQGITAFAILIALQFAIAWGSHRSSFFEKIIKSEPSLVFHQGKFLKEKMKQERLSREEILASIRSQGYSDSRDVEAVILETNGELSVIARQSLSGTRLAEQFDTISSPLEETS